MSETTETTPAPEPEPTPTPAPESTPAETEEQQPAREADEEQQTRGGEKRFAIITAKLSAAERLYNAQQAELEFYRRQVQQQIPAEETPEQRMARIERDADARAEERLLQRRFHEEGQAQYRDWAQKTKDLMAMGADGGMGRLLIEMAGGVRVAAALADDPTELQRIVDIPSERGRAIALGRYAATLDADDGATRAPRPAPQVTRAPAPIRPVTGRASPQVNLYTMTGEQAVDYFMKENLEKQRANR
jgi:hypothetical protein